jgi:hypothetical protein
MAWLGLVAGRRLPLPVPPINLSRPTRHQRSLKRRRAWAWWAGGVVSWVLLAVFALPVLAAALLAGGLLLALTLLVLERTHPTQPRTNRLGPVRQMTPPPAPLSPCRIPANPPSRRRGI